jgi:hypothetical protein
LFCSSLCCIFTFPEQEKRSQKIIREKLLSSGQSHHRGFLGRYVL